MMNREVLYRPAAWFLCMWAALLLLDGAMVALAERSRDSIPRSMGSAPVGTVRYVARSGHDSGNSCTAKASPCSTVQHAVDVAVPGDEIRVTGGTYARAGTVASVAKRLRVRGGYDPGFGSSDPAQYETVLDAQEGGSVVQISNAGEVWLEHLTLTHGNGAANCEGLGCGGGIYAVDTALHVTDCTITDNVGSRSGRAEGGGLYAAGSAVEILESTVVSNTANASSTSTDSGSGGGIYISQGAANLVGNRFLDNRATLIASGFGGGVCLDNLTHGEVVSNTFAANQANTYGYYGSYGGGLYISSSAAVTVADNRIEGNLSNGSGGGVEIVWSDVNLTGNLILDNIAAGGGGVFVQSAIPVTLSNNLIAGNRAGFLGGGVYASLNGPPGSQVLLVNNTIADNGDAGVASWSYAVYTLTNNLIAGHDTGIVTHRPFSATIVADTNLFWNTSDPILGAHAARQDPRLTADYHLWAGSPAVDKGLPIPWLTVDLDGEPRPQGSGYDLGAYEGEEPAWPIFLPVVLRNQR